MGRDQRQSSARRLVLLALLALLAGIGFVVWVGPQLAGWVNTGRWTPLGFWQAQARRSAPWQARARTATYPPALRRSLPPGWEFWTVQAVVAITAVSVAVVAVREIDVRATDQQAGVDVVSARARAVIICAIGGEEGPLHSARGCPGLRSTQGRQ
jgi:hypothetical protein